MEQEVIAYLKENPEFFERHAHLLTDLTLPNPYGEGTISLTQRQQLAQRDKIRVLESKFTELVINAEENQETAQKIHRLTLQLLAAPDFVTLESDLTQTLSADFDLPNCQLKLWSLTNLIVDKIDPFVVPDQTVIDWAQDLSQPYCGTMPKVDISEWFKEQPGSIAMVPLRTADGTFGLLVLPSQDRHHFYNGMGTVFLNQLGELLSAALLKYLN